MPNTRPKAPAYLTSASTAYNRAVAHRHSSTAKLATAALAALRRGCSRNTVIKVVPRYRSWVFALADTHNIPYASSGFRPAGHPEPAVPRALVTASEHTRAADARVVATREALTAAVLDAIRDGWTRAEIVAACPWGSTWVGVLATREGLTFARAAAHGQADDSPPPTTRAARAASAADRAARRSRAVTVAVDDAPARPARKRPRTTTTGDVAEPAARGRRRRAPKP